jgi:hypothetical protein
VRLIYSAGNKSRRFLHALRRDQSRTTPARKMPRCYRWTEDSRQHCASRFTIDRMGKAQSQLLISNANNVVTGQQVLGRAHSKSQRCGGAQARDVFARLRGCVRDAGEEYEYDGHADSGRCGLECSGCVGNAMMAWRRTGRVCCAS